MRLAISVSLALCACQPVPQPVPQPEARRENPVPPPIAPAPEDRLARIIIPPVPAASPSFATATQRGITFEGVAFDSRTHRLRVIDQPHGPGTAYATARDAANRHGALAAMNAGFFTPEGKPLGLVIAGGKRSGAWNSASSLGSGIFAENGTGRLSISRRGSPSAFHDARELIQAGPLLVENGGAVGGLDPGKMAVRSILLTDGGTRWWIGKTSSCSLAALGDALASQSPAPWPVRHALNLDGGRSTDLFVSPKTPGGPFERRSVFNRPVRNFLILEPR